MEGSASPSRDGLSKEDAGHIPASRALVGRKPADYPHAVVTLCLTL